MIDPGIGKGALNTSLFFIDWNIIVFACERELRANSRDTVDSLANDG